MNHFVALVLKVAVFLVFAGSTLGDGEGDEVPQRVCPTLDEGKPMHLNMYEVAMLYGSPDDTDFNPLIYCTRTLVYRYQMLSYIDVSWFSRPYFFYRDVVQAKKCVSLLTDGDQRQKSAVESLLNVMSEDLKCYHPEDDCALLCKNLDPKEDGSSRVCPIKSIDERIKPLYDSLRDRFPYCHLPLTIILNETLFEDNFDSLEESRVYFKNECRKLPGIKNCLKEISSLSSSCLDVKHDLMLSTIKNLMTNILEHVCIEEGQHLANVVFNIARRDVANNSDPNANFRRFPSGKLAVKKAFATDVTSQKTLELYRDIKMFKGRLVNYLQGDDDAVSSAELILNGVIENMKCLDRELTTSVLCSSIADSA